MRHIALILPAVFSAIPALAQQPGEPLRFETLRDAYQRQQADDYRSRESSRLLLQNERSTPLGESRVHVDAERRLYDPAAEFRASAPALK